MSKDDRKPGGMPDPSLPAMVTILLLASFLTGNLLNSDVLAVDFHEVYVARTAEEMLERGNWLIPTLNGKPRLNKPPLAYWTTMLADRAIKADGRISHLEARIPSMIAMIIMVFATFAMGVVTGGRWLGFLAGLIISGSLGAASYAHNARPDMLYTAFCTAGLAAFLHAMQLKRVRRCLALIGWLFFTLAALAKGPQVPLLFLLIIVIYCWRTGHVTSIRGTFQPWIGLPVFIIGSVWWYMVLMLRGQDVLAAFTGEMGERIGDEGIDWGKYFIPDYLYRTAALLAPWCLFYGLAFAVPWLRLHHPSSMVSGCEQNNRSPTTIDRRLWILGLLWWIGIITIVMFQLLPERRAAYTLPMIVPWAVLMAAAILHFFRKWQQAGKIWLIQVIIIGHVLIIGCTPLIVYFINPSLSKPPLWATIGMLAMIIAIIMVFITRPCLRAGNHAIAIMLLMSPCTLFTLTINASLWDTERFHQRQASLEIGQVVPSDALLIGWRTDLFEVQYYLHRPVGKIRDEEALREQCKRYHQIYIVARADVPPLEGLVYEELARVDRYGRGRDHDIFIVWRVSQPPDVAELMDSIHIPAPSVNSKGKSKSSSRCALVRANRSMS